MDRAKLCTSTERSVIQNLKYKGQRQRQIEKMIVRSQNFVFNDLKGKENHSIRSRARKTSAKEDNSIKLWSTWDPLNSIET